MMPFRFRCGPKTRLAFIFPLVLGSWTFTQVAQLYAIEQSFCRQHYKLAPGTDLELSNGNAAKPMYDCKIPSIQANTALYNGILQGVVLLPALLCAGAYNNLARSWGRQAVFSLNAVGILTQILFRILICYFPKTFPIEWIFGTSIFVAIGGGDTLQWGLLYAYIFESVSYGNAMHFMCYSSAYLAACRTVSVFLGGALLGRSVWLLWFAAVVVTALIAVGAWFMPKSASKTGPNYELVGEDGDVAFDERAGAAPRRGDPDADLEDPSHFETDDLAEPDDEGTAANGGAANASSLDMKRRSGSLSQPFGPGSSLKQSVLSAMLSELYTSATFSYHALTSKPLQRSIMLVFFFTNIGVGAEMVLQQYMSQAYSWPLSRAAEVASLELGAATFVLLCLPTLSGVIGRALSLAESHAILIVLYGSLLCCFVGGVFLGMGFPWFLFLCSLAVYTLGYGGFDAIRAFASTQTHGERATTELTLLITMTEQLTVLFSGPMSNLLFSWTLSVPAAPNGLVFWAQAACSVVAFWFAWKLWKTRPSAMPEGSAIRH